MAPKRSVKKVKKAAASPRPRTAKLEGEAAALAKIAAMPAPFSAMGERLHGLITRSAPTLQPTVWYGMPAYARDGKTVCFFRADKKYMTFAFTLEANLSPEEGTPHQLIASAWYFAALDDATEARLRALARKAAS